MRNLDLKSQVSYHLNELMTQLNTYLCKVEQLPKKKEHTSQAPIYSFGTSGTSLNPKSPSKATTTSLLTEIWHRAMEQAVRVLTQPKYPHGRACWSDVKEGKAPQLFVPHLSAGFICSLVLSCLSSLCWCWFEGHCIVRHSTIQRYPETSSFPYWRETFANFSKS